MAGFKTALLGTIMSVSILICQAGGRPMTNAAERHSDCNRPGYRHPIEIQETEQGFLVSDKGRKVFFYQRSPKSIDGKFTRANYVHPLYGLDGQILTEDFPADHPHHRGIFWAWHQLYVADKKLGDSWSLEDFSCDVHSVKILDVDSKSKAIQAKVYWKSSLWTGRDGEEKAFVEETTTIRIFSAEGDMRKIDFEITLLALEKGVRIGGSDNARGYGGFSARIKLPDGLEFTDPNGRVEPKTTAVAPAPWMDFSGQLGDGDKTSGLAIICDKSNPGYPHKWILRRKGSMQNAVWPGREPVPLSTEKPTVLRYRLIIHRGRCDPAGLDKLQAEEDCRSGNDRPAG